MRNVLGSCTLIGAVALFIGWGCTSESEVGDNGRADGGLLPNVNDGRCGDGVDDNGNGFVDEGCPCTPGEQAACFDGPASARNIGACADGVMVCPGTGEFSTWANECSGSTLPSPETCNAIDDDCDGAVDEGCECTQPGQTRVCGAAQGLAPPCKPGEQTCGDGGTWSECEAAVLPGLEVCGDGVDNDCNGVVDDQCEQDGGTGGHDGGTDGGDAGCVPTPEICGDGIDQDCNGYTDDGCPCVEPPVVVLETVPTSGVDFAPGRQLSLASSGTHLMASWRSVDDIHYALLDAEGTQVGGTKAMSGIGGLGMAGVPGGWASTYVGQPESDGTRSVFLQWLDESGDASGSPIEIERAPLGPCYGGSSPTCSPTSAHPRLSWNGERLLVAWGSDPEFVISTTAPTAIRLAVFAPFGSAPESLTKFDPGFERTAALNTGIDALDVAAHGNGWALVTAARMSTDYPGSTRLYATTVASDGTAGNAIGLGVDQLEASGEPGPGALSVRITAQPDGYQVIWETDFMGLRYSRGRLTTDLTPVGSPAQLWAAPTDQAMVVGTDMAWYQGTMAGNRFIAAYGTLGYTVSSEYGVRVVRFDGDTQLSNELIAQNQPQYPILRNGPDVAVNTVAGRAAVLHGVSRTNGPGDGEKDIVLHLICP